MAAKENFRIVTNEYEYKVQERLKTFWRGREYWTDVVESGQWGDYTIVPKYETLEEAEQTMKAYVVQAARYINKWKPV